MKSLADKFYERISKVLKVPVGPLDPNGETVIRGFTPAPRYARYRLCSWVFTQLSILIPFAIFLFPDEFYGFLGRFGLDWVRNLDFSAHWEENIPAFLQMPAKILSIAVYFIQFVFSFISTFVAAKSPSYLLTDRSLRIRRGLWLLKENTFSLKNIQQVRFSQKMLERLWGIGTLEVRTAGGGTSATNDKKEKDKSHRGELVGLLDPFDLRELLNGAIKDASRVKSNRRAQADTTIATPAPSPGMEEAFQELLLASQFLREDIEARKASKQGKL